MTSWAAAVRALAITLRRGVRFRHATQITRTSSAKNPAPESCGDTRVTKDVVYDRNSTGFRSCIERDRFPEVVREWTRD